MTGRSTEVSPVVPWADVVGDGDCRRLGTCRAPPPGALGLAAGPQIPAKQSTPPDDEKGTMITTIPFTIGSEQVPE